MEIPVEDSEKAVLSLIVEGYHNPDIRKNHHLSLISFMKVESSEEMELYIYKTYFAEKVDKMSIVGFQSPNAKKIKPPNKADTIRIQNLEKSVSSQRQHIFDFVLLDYLVASTTDALYTLMKFRGLSIRGVNKYLNQAIDAYIKSADTSSPRAITDLFHNSVKYIERNKALMEYDDSALYVHQRELFRAFSGAKDAPKCVLYMAPTGTGKTLSPLGLAQDYRVIFVCAARHVGLALARSAITAGRRVAFAFGCETASDIRLHYFAAADFTVNKRSGGIHRVDNSNGSRVEIMICDIASYLVAMYYMKAFHSERDIIMYWDEPTISMDSVEEDSALHHLIHRVWALNQISKIVLSCATLPKQDEIGPALQDFCAKFADIGTPEIKVIDSHDCKKTISLLSKDGKIALPHLLFSDYSTLIMDCVEHCETNRSLLRYFDIQEIVRFAEHVQPFLREEDRIERRFQRIDDITLYSIKTYYLDIMRLLPEDRWASIHKYMCDSVRDTTVSIRKIKSETADPKRGGGALTRQSSVVGPTPQDQNPAKGILLTTTDAHTLTDGPTIFLAEDVEKIGRFYIQQTKIPESVFSIIQQKIDKNNVIQKQLRRLEHELETSSGEKPDDKSQKDKGSKKAEKEPASKETRRLIEQIADLKESIHSVHLNPVYIPNTKQHQDVWVKSAHISNAFAPNVDEEDVREIMGLDLDNQRKLLLILGIGVMTSSQQITQSELIYAEIMKRLAYEQRLFLIIASSDYIYGTNYQFCHGFIGKDLTNMTQQKTIQAIGRVGRNNIQQEYTVRFRDEDVLRQLFRKAKTNLEAITMNRLFCSDDDDDDDDEV